MSAKQILLDQLDASYRENGWFVCLKNALEDVTQEQSTWRIDGLDHTVRESVIHITYWCDRWLRRYRGDEPCASKGEISETFLGDREPDWEAEKAELFRVMEGWMNALENITDEKLNEQVSDSYAEPWYVPLAHQNIHIAYHAGQIVAARKLQKAWDSSKGVF